MAPKIILAEGSTNSPTYLAASLISTIFKSLPMTLNNTPLAPLGDISNKGEPTAALTALTALSAPLALPMPINAIPASCNTVLMSAKSVLIIPGTLINSATPLTECFKISSIASKASFKGVF